MTTPTQSGRRGYDLAVIAYCTSRIQLELQHGELDRYHRDDCASALRRPRAAFDGRGLPYLDHADCDCDGPERLHALLEGDLASLAILESWSAVELSDSMRKMLDTIAKPYADRTDFPAQP